MKCEKQDVDKSQAMIPHIDQFCPGELKLKGYLLSKFVFLLLRSLEILYGKYGGGQLGMLIIQSECIFVVYPISTMQ